MGTLIILSVNGDDRLDWDVNDPESIRTACAKFISLRKQGYFIYKVISSKENQISDFDPNIGGLMFRRSEVPEPEPEVLSGEQINEFDPKVEKIIANPPLVGG